MAGVAARSAFILIGKSSARSKSATNIYKSGSNSFKKQNHQRNQIRNHIVNIKNQIQNHTIKNQNQN